MNNQWRDNSNRMVVWADGTYDMTRTCDQCSSPTCSMPVHQDRYRQLGTTNLETSEAEEAVGYWAWLSMIGVTTPDAEHIEPTAANPDNLLETDTRSSGTPKDQHVWMAEAYEQLTGAQREVWDLVMREQVSQVDAAKKLGISPQAVSIRLSAAKQSVTEYLRTKQENEFA